jgi:hypothetical protein
MFITVFLKLLNCIKYDCTLWSYNYCRTQVNFEFTIIRSNVLCDCADTGLWLVMFMQGQGAYACFKILAKNLNNIKL